MHMKKKRKKSFSGGKRLRKKVRHSVRKKKVKKMAKNRRAVRNKGEKNLRVPVGIRNFDSMIQGGFEKNSTNLLVGGSGSGKTVFATEFLIAGMKQGEKCLYVTFEEKKEQFYHNMASFGWDMDAYERKGLFTFLEYTPIKVKTMLEEGGGAIESIILKKKITRIVIDSITSFALLFQDELERRGAALSLFGMIRGWDATALLTLEEEPSPDGLISSEAMKFESDSLIVMYFLRRHGMRQRFLEVIKMRGTKHSNRVYPFELNKGIDLKKSPVSDFFER
jgi:circadian clock protein KaiC